MWAPLALAWRGSHKAPLMPTQLAQWTGIAVTAIVVLGSDIDVVYAVPLGLFAGALATFFASLADETISLRRRESR